LRLVIEIKEGLKVVKLEVIDIETGKLRWTENHTTKEEALTAVEKMKKDHFNPDYFRFVIKS
jgi:hypothetical protein